MKTVLLKAFVDSSLQRRLRYNKQWTMNHHRQGGYVYAYSSVCLFVCEQVHVKPLIGYLWKIFAGNVSLDKEITVKFRQSSVGLSTKKVTPKYRSL